MSYFALIFHESRPFGTSLWLSKIAPGDFVIHRNVVYDKNAGAFFVHMGVTHADVHGCTNAASAGAQELPNRKHCKLKQKTPSCKQLGVCCLNLAMSYFHMGNPTLSSALSGFTSEFEMGSGGARSLWSPENWSEYRES